MSDAQKRRAARKRKAPVGTPVGSKDLGNLLEEAAVALETGGQSIGNFSAAERDKAVELANLREQRAQGDAASSREADPTLEELKTDYSQHMSVEPESDLVAGGQSVGRPQSTDFSETEGMERGDQSPEAAQARVFAAALTGDNAALRNYEARLNRSERKGQLSVAEQQKAFEKQEEFTKQKQQALEVAMENRQIELEEERQQIQDAEEIRANTLNESRQAIRAAEDRVANFEIDPKRIYKDTMSAVGSALAVALGSFGAALTGTENTAFKILDAAVDRDIAAQRTELGKLQYMVGRKSSEYQMLMSEHKNEREVESLLRGQADKVFSMKLNEIEAQYGALIEPQKIRALRAQLQERAADREITMHTSKFNAAMKNRAMNIQSYAATARVKAMNAKKTAAGFKDADMRKSMRNALAARDTIAFAKAEMEKRDTGYMAAVGRGIKGHFPGIYTSEDEFDNTMARLAMSLITSKSGASFTDVSYEHIKEQLPGKTDTVDTALTKLGDAERDLNAILRANYDIMTPEEQIYYEQTVGAPPTRNEDPTANFMALLKGQELRM